MTKEKIQKNLGWSSLTANFILAGVFVFFGLIFAAKPAQAINQQITFQGKLTNTSGYNVANGTYYVKLTIYDALTGGSCQYSATSSCASVTSTPVTVTNGIFSVNLGDTSASLAALPATLFNAPSLFLGITVCSGPSTGCDSEMTPRKRLTSVPYAFNADYLGGITTSTSGGNGSYIPATDSSGNLKISNSVFIATSTTGQFGVGTSTVPSGYKSYIESTTAADHLLVIRGKATQSGAMTAWQDSSGGTLGYFTTSTSGGLPYFELNLSGDDATRSGMLYVDNGAYLVQSQLYIGDGTASGTYSYANIILNQQPGYNQGTFFVSDGVSSVSVSGTLGTFGNITSGGHFYPRSDNLYDIGASSTQWRYGNFQGGLLVADGTTTSTLSNNSLISGQTSGSNLGKFYIDSSGNVSASGSLYTFGNVTSTGNATLGDSDAAGGDTTRVYGALVMGLAPTGAAQLAIQASSTTAIPLLIKASDDTSILQTASSSLTFLFDGADYFSQGLALLTLGQTNGALNTAINLKNGGALVVRAPSSENVLAQVGLIGNDGDYYGGLVVSKGGTTTTTLDYQSLILGQATGFKKGKFYVDSSGNVSASGTLAITGHFTPYTDNLYDIGSSSTQWRYGNFQGGLLVADGTTTGTLSNNSLIIAQGSSDNLGKFYVDSSGNVSASGSLGVGQNITASGSNSLSFGANSSSTGQNAFAGGSYSTAKGDQSFAFGKWAGAYGNWSVAMGNNVTSTGSTGFAFGANVQATANNTFVFGRGDYTVDNAPLVNNTLESFMVGFGSSTVPALMVSGAGINSVVGIATTSMIFAGSTRYRLLVDAQGSTNAGIGVNGYIKATGAITQSTSLDLAEKYPIDPACEARGDCPEAGDVVAVNDSAMEGQAFGIFKASATEQGKVIGIVSTQPAFTMEGGLKDSVSRLLALAGRVPVKISTENGAIKIGDKLTVSATVPGAAMKYTGSGTIVGMALENYSSLALGKIVTYVSLSWNKDAGNPADLTTQTDASGQLTQQDLNLGGYNILNVKSIAGKDNKWEIDENGWLINKLITTQGEKKVYSVASESAEINLSGFGQLVNGEARIDFEAATREIISSSTPLKISITLTAPANGVYVLKKDGWGFIVKELNGGVSNATFDWVVIARRKTQAEMDAAMARMNAETTPTSADTAGATSTVIVILPADEAGPADAGIQDAISSSTVSTTTEGVATE